MTGESRGQKRKVKWVVGAQAGKGKQSVPPPTTMRNGRRGVTGKRHRGGKAR